MAEVIEHEIHFGCADILHHKDLAMSLQIVDK
jgi:hypothetical protein